MTGTTLTREKAALEFLKRITQTIQIEPIKPFDEIEKRKSLKTISTISVDSMIDPLVVYYHKGMCSLFSIQTQIQTRKLIKTRRTITERMGLTMDTIKRRKAESYQNLLEPQGTLEKKVVSMYDPWYLDHPDLQSGKNKTVITLPCFLGSIIQPSTPHELKRELNELFKQSHPGIDMISLSQIRELKKELMKIGFESFLEASSIALSFAYFEKLILKSVVNKLNKKLIAGVCLLLAVKVNDPKDYTYSKLMQNISKALEIPTKEIYQSEFSVYVALEFSLFLPLVELEPHLARIMKISQVQLQ